MGYDFYNYLTEGGDVCLPERLSPFLAMLERPMWQKKTLRLIPSCQPNEALGPTVQRT